MMISILVNQKRYFGCYTKYFFANFLHISDSNWSSQINDIENCLLGCHDWPRNLGVLQVQSMVDNYKGANADISQMCKAISEMLLVHIDSRRVYENLEFEEDQVSHGNEAEQTIWSFRLNCVQVWRFHFFFMLCSLFDFVATYMGCHSAGRK